MLRPQIGLVLLTGLRYGHYLVVFVPLAQYAVDAQQLEVLLAECLNALHRVDLAHLRLRSLLIALHHALISFTLIFSWVEHQ